MNFQEQQRADVLSAVKTIKDMYAEVEYYGLPVKDYFAYLTVVLLEKIATHPSLMDSTYEPDEDIQNAVNNLVEVINNAKFVPHVS